MICDLVICKQSYLSSNISDLLNFKTPKNYIIKLPTLTYPELFQTLLSLWICNPEICDPIGSRARSHQDRIVNLGVILLQIDSENDFSICGTLLSFLDVRSCDM